jgi:hypothetical protein
MKSIVAPLVFAVVLALAGTGFWLAGQTETRLADAHKRLATLQYSEAAAASDEVEQSIGLERRNSTYATFVRRPGTGERITRRYRPSAMRPAR